MEEYVESLDLESFFSPELLDFLEQQEAPSIEAEASSTTTEASSFAVVDQAGLKKLRDKNRNKNTERSTSTWVNSFQKWQESRGVIVSLPDISPQEFDTILQQYFAEIRTERGGEYEPDSLRTMLGAMHRYVKSTGYTYSILTGLEFAGCREVLNGKAVVLRESGMGKRKRKADYLTEEEEEEMWKTGVLGNSSPQSLNHTIFFPV